MMQHPKIVPLQLNMLNLKRRKMADTKFTDEAQEPDLVKSAPNIFCKICFHQRCRDNPFHWKQNSGTIVGRTDRRVAGSFCLVRDGWRLTQHSHKARHLPRTEKRNRSTNPRLPATSPVNICRSHCITGRSFFGKLYLSLLALRNPHSSM